jgi:hypothetical protein
VFACSNRFQGPRVMEVIGQWDIDSVYILISQEIIISVVDMINVVIGYRLPGIFR